MDGYGGYGYYRKGKADADGEAPDLLLLLSRSLPRAGRREADARLRPPRCPVAGEPAEPSRTATARLDLYGF